MYLNATRKGNSTETFFVTMEINLQVSIQTFNVTCQMSPPLSKHVTRRQAVILDGSLRIMVQ